MTSISKSKYVLGLQCPKLFWTHYNDKQAIPEPDEAKQAVFDVGHAVGDLAKQLYPDGVEVPWDKDYEKTVVETRELLKQRVPIFEASFLVDGCYCRVDIMVPATDGTWDLYEVKSTTSVKDVNIADVGFQAHAIEKSGVWLNRLFLMHIDNSYIRQGEIDPRGLFHAEDITLAAREHQPSVSKNVRWMFDVIESDRPETPIGPHCSKPYPCDLWATCSAFLPEHPVLEYYYLGRDKAFELIHGETAALVDVSEDRLNTKQLIQKRAVQTDQVQVDPDPLRRWLRTLTYPLYCFDFETMSSAIPLLEGTRPFQHIPFQFSLHVLESPGAEPRHVEFLAEDPIDPRPELIKAMKAIGPDGTILAFHMSFEKGVIQKLAEDFPEKSEFLTGLLDRFMDLKTPFSSFWYHDAKQKGSCSLKYVLPALTGISYEGMEIADGGAAMREFVRVVFGEVPVDEKTRVLEAMRRYCEQDTLALVKILRKLEAEV